jgi:DNA-binding beta-propeller fold protein YncE
LNFFPTKLDFMKKTTTTLMLCIILFSACVKNNLKNEISASEQLSGPAYTPCYYPTATVSTHAGSGYSGYVNGNVLLAQFKNPQGLTSFGSSQFVGDKRYIRRITGTTVSTFVTLPDGENIYCLAADISGNIYAAVGEYSDPSVVKKFSSTGTLLATYGSFKHIGYRDGISPRFTMITGLAVDETGLVYVAEMANYAIRVIGLDGTVSTLAGGLGEGRPGHGFEDGPVSTAKFGFIQGVAVTPAGDKVYVADDHAVRLITEGYVYTIAGGSAKGIVDGDGLSARFHELSGIALDGAGNLYVTDSRFVYPYASEYGSYIRKVIHMTSGLVAWKVTTLAGNSYGYANGTGLAAKFYRPAELVIDNAGTTAYIADPENYRIRKMTLACGITF